MDIGAIRLELKALLGVNVDVLIPNALPESFREQRLLDYLQHMRFICLYRMIDRQRIKKSTIAESIETV